MPNYMPFFPTLFSFLLILNLSMFYGLQPVKQGFAFNSCETVPGILLTNCRESANDSLQYRQVLVKGGNIRVELIRKGLDSFLR